MNTSSGLRKITEYFSSPATLKLLGLFFAATGAIFLIFGFAISFIVQGLFFFVLRLSSFSASVHKLLGPLAFPLSDSLNKRGVWKWAMFLVMSLPELLFTAAGVWLLVTLGFEHQNFIFLFFLK